jgi:hypothetical protein
MPRRLSRRLILACLLAASIAPWLAAIGHAEDRRISLTVHVGYHDVTRAGQWMPVTIDATNRGPDFQGWLELQNQDANPLMGVVAVPGGPKGLVSVATYRVALNLPSGATKHVRAYLLADNPNAQVIARLVEKGRVAASPAAVTPTMAHLMVGVLSDEPSALDDFGVLHLPNRLTPYVVHLRREDVADSGILLRAFDVLAIDSFATLSLTAAQQRALGNYVAIGGNLLLGSGAAWQKTLGGLPSDLVPMQITGTTYLKRSKALPDGVEVAVGTTTKGHVWLADGGYPLLIEQALGAGSVTLATFDWAQAPVFGWIGLRELLRQFLIRNLYAGSGQAITIGNVPDTMPMFNINAGGSITQRSNNVGGLTNLPGLVPPSLKVTGLLILLYVLIIGPLNYLALRAIGRRELAWITLPLAAVFSAAGAYGFAISTKGNSVQSNQVSIVHVTPGWKDAYVEAYTSLVTPTRGDFRVTIEGGQPLFAPLGVEYRSSQGILRMLPEQSAVDLLGMSAYAFRGFASESMVAAPRLTANINLSGGKLVGRIENHSSVTYPDAVLIAGDSYQTIGKLAPGAGANVDLAAEVSKSGMPSYHRLYPGGQSFSTPYGRTVPLAPQTKAQQRGQVLQLLLSNVAGRTPATVSPVLVLWTPDSVQQIKVNGQIPRPHALNAIAIPLTIEPLGPGTLPAGIVTGRLVDLKGEATSIGPHMVSVQSGSATFEFAPVLAAGTRLTGVSLNCWNLYGPRSIAPVGEAWNWSKSAWVPVSVGEYGAMPLPDGVFNEATSVLRLRISTPTNSRGVNPLQMLSISLTGTVE